MAKNIKAGVAESDYKEVQVPLGTPIADSFDEKVYHLNLNRCVARRIRFKIMI